MSGSLAPVAARLRGVTELVPQAQDEKKKKKNAPLVFSLKSCEEK